MLRRLETGRGKQIILLPTRAGLRIVRIGSGIESVLDSLGLPLRLRVRPGLRKGFEAVTLATLSAKARISRLVWAISRAATASARALMLVSAAKTAALIAPSAVRWASSCLFRKSSEPVAGVSPVGLI